MTDTPASSNTQDLARDLAGSEVGKALNLSVAKSQDIILAIVESVAEHLAKGETVRVHNLGNFKVLPTKAREGKNPRTQERIKIEAGKRVHLAVSAYLKTSATDGKVPVRESRAAQAPAAPAAKPAGRQPKAATPAKGTVKTAPAKGGFRPAAPPQTPAAGGKTDDI